MKKKQFILYIILSVIIFLITDNFLFAQTRELHKLDSLLKTNDLNLFSRKLNQIDTANFNSDNNKAKLYSLLAKYFDKKEKAELALEYYKKAEYFYHKNKSLNKEADIQYEIFILLNSQENLKNIESKKSIYRYIDYAKKNNDKNRLIKAYMGLARININPKKYKKSIEYYNIALNISKDINDQLTQAKIYSNKAIIINLFYKNKDSAIIYLKKSETLYSKLFNSTINISKIYQNEKEYNKALSWLNKATKIPIVSYKNNSKKLLFQLMAANYDSLKDYKNANLYLKKYLAYKDSVDIKAQNIAISDIQTKYDTAQKEKDIIKLKAEKDRQKYFIIAVIFLLFSSVLIGLLFIFNLRRKKDIAEKTIQIEHNKIETMVKEQELKTLDAIVKGQEKERKRIAEDLHDNLGSKLAVLKLHFDNFIDIANTNKNTKQIEKLKTTSNLLEETYQTVRSMSHVENESEITQSLIHSVKSLANSITKSKKLEIEVINFGLENPINYKIEFFALRIIQELITNIIKYSKADKASIDLTLFERLLVIIVSDNGIGFDTSKIGFKGIGLKTMKEKVESFKGSLTIDSGLGSGTTVIIELPTNNKNL